VVYSQFYWNDKPAAETVREYIAFEYSPDVADDIAGVVKTLEQNHHWRWWPGELEGVKLEMDWFPSKGAKPQEDPGAEEAYATMRRVDGLLTPQAKKAWRWRQLYLRALLDAELKANGGKPNDKCNEAFAELIKIYHAEQANPAVRPPLPKARSSISTFSTGRASNFNCRPCPKKIVAASVLTGGQVSVKQDGQELLISLPAAQRDKIDTTIKLELEESI
jgi:hypothetical protein